MTPKMLTALRADPRVSSIEDERRFGNGWWCYLATGWAYGGTGESHCFSEDKLTDIKRALKYIVTRCECDDCRRGKPIWK